MLKNTLRECVAHATSPVNYCANAKFSSYLFVLLSSIILCTSVNAQEIDVMGGTGMQSISDGSVSPMVANGTDFQSIPNGSMKTNTFTIENSGVSDLTIDAAGIIINSATPGVFTLGTVSETLPATLMQGESMSFQIVFTPNAGNNTLFTGDVSIENNDADEDPYTFEIKGRGNNNPAYMTYVVTNTNDSGAGSLRQALTDANNNPGLDFVHFNIAGAGIHLISLSSDLPTITDDLILDATTQPGYAGSPLVQVNRGSDTWQITVNGVKEIEIKGLNLSRTTTSMFEYGVNVLNSSDVRIYDNVINYRRVAINIVNSKDVIIMGNDCKHSGDDSNGSRFAIILSNIIEDELEGGIYMDDNAFGGTSDGALFVSTSANLLISNGSIPGSNIIIADNSGFNEILPNFNNGDCLLRIDNCSNVEIMNLDFKHPTMTNSTGMAIRVNNSLGNKNITIDGCDFTERYAGIRINGGRDVTVTNNAFANCGNSFNYPAIYLANIKSSSLPGGVFIDGNTFGGLNADSGFSFTNMDNLTISDGSVGGSNVIIDDASGFNMLDDNYMMFFSSCNNILIDNIDFSSGTLHRGYPIIQSQSNSVTVQNCDFSNRRQGIQATGGTDYTVINNDFTNCGDNPNRPALFFNGISEGSIPKGILCHSNTLGGASSNTILRFQGVDNLNISNQVNANTQITIEDASGLNTGGTGIAVYVLNSHNLMIEDVDLSSSGGQVGTALQLQNVSGSTIQNCDLSNRRKGVNASGGHDLTILNCDFTGTGFNINEYAVDINNVQPSSISGGVMMSGNTWGASSNSRAGLKLNNMADLLISGNMAHNPNILLEATSGIDELTDNPLRLDNSDNITIRELELSSSSSQTGNGLIAANCEILEIRDINSMNRAIGINVSNSSDVSILDCDVSDSGSNSGSSFAINLNNIFENASTGNKLTMSGVQFGGTSSSAGLFLQSSQGITIADAPGAGVDVVIADTDGLEEVSSRAIYLNNCEDIIVDNLLLSYTAGSRTGDGIFSSSSQNIEIKNCTVHNRNIGVNCQNGFDHKINNSSFTDSGSGSSGTHGAIFLSNIQEKNLPGGVLIEDNAFSGTSAMLFFIQNMKDIILSDGTTPGTNIKIAPADGATDISGNDLVYFHTSDNINVSNIDLGYTGMTKGGRAFQFNNCASVILDDLTINNRQQAVIINNGSDFTVTNSDFMDCSNGTNSYSLSFVGIQEQSLAGGLNMSGNVFGGTSGDYAVEFRSMSDLTITDASGGGNVIFEDATSGFNNVTEVPLKLDQVNNIIINDVDFSKSGTQDGTGLIISNTLTDAGNNINIINCNVTNRAEGMNISGTQSLTVTGCDFTDTGFNSVNPSLYLHQIYSNAITVNGNTFANSGGSAVTSHAFIIDDVDDLIISDGSVPLTNIVIPSVNSLDDYSGIVFNIQNLEGVLFSDLNLSGTTSTEAIRFSNSNDIKVCNSSFTNWNYGLRSLGNSNTYNLTCNSFTTNTRGIDLADTEKVTIQENDFLGNTSFAIVTSNPNGIKAQENYWGSADGSSTDGGSGDAYSGIVDASNFLTSNSSCPPSTMPEIEVLGNREFIEDGTTLVSTDDNTDMGGITLNTDLKKSFTIRNIGSANLEITAINFSGTDAGDFSIASITLPATILPGEETEFEVVFNTASTGAKTATIEIVNNDADEANYDFNLEAEGRDIIFVTNTNDSGAGSMREAITIANANMGPDLIHFNIPVSSPPYIIALNTDLPAISDPLTIDGTTQPGYAGSPVVQLSASNQNNDMSYLQANGITGLTFRGLKIKRIINSPYVGYGISLTSCHDVLIEQNVMNYLRGAISMNGGSDITIQGNDLKFCGDNSSLIRSTIGLQNIVENNISKGVDIDNNIFGSGHFGLFLVNLVDGLIISDGMTANTNITLDPATSKLGEYTSYSIRIFDTDDLEIRGIHVNKSGSRQGIGLDIVNCNNILVDDCEIQNRWSGLNVSGGSDLSLTNNDFTDSGDGNSNQRGAINLDGIAENLIVKGIEINSNTFGGTTQQLFYLSNLEDGIIISDGTVGGTHIAIENTSGANSMNGNGMQIRVFNTDDILVDNIDLTRLSSRAGIGIQFLSCESPIIKNCKISNRWQSINFSGCSDVTAQDNDLTNGSDGNSATRAAIAISDNSADALPNGVLISGNNFQDAVMGISIDGVDNLHISNSLATPGTDVALEDMTHNLQSTTYLLHLINCDNALIEDINVIHSGTGNTAVRLDDCHSVQNDNCTFNNFNNAFRVTDGSDIQFTNCDVQACGENNGNSSNATFYLDGVRENVLQGGVLIQSCTFGNDLRVLYAHEMLDLIISDGTVPNTNITLTGIQSSITGGTGVLEFHDCRNVHVESLTLQRPSGISGHAVQCNDVDMATITDCVFSGWDCAVNATDGFDHTVTSNNIQDCGGTNRTAGAITFKNVKGSTIADGVIVNNNTFSNLRDVLRIELMDNITIAPDAAGGADIIFPVLNSDWETCTGTMLIIDDASDLLVRDLDLSYMNTGKQGYGVYVTNSSDVIDDMTIQDCIINYRNGGIRVSNGRDLTVMDCDLRNSGTNFSSDNHGLSIISVSPDAIPGGLNVKNNLFGGPDASVGIYLSGMSDIIISDGTMNTPHIELLPASGINNIHNLNDFRYANIYLDNMTNTQITDLDLSGTATTFMRGSGIYVGGSDSKGTQILRNNLADHSYGVYVDQGADFTIKSNTLSGNDISCLHLQSIREINIDGGLDVEDNVFGGGDETTAVSLLFSSDITFGNSSTPNANIIFKAADNLSDVALQSNDINSNRVLFISSCSDIQIKDLDLSSSTTQTGFGIYFDNSGRQYGSNTVENCIINNRYVAIESSSGTDMNFIGNDFRNSGSSTSAHALRVRSLVAENLQGGLNVSGNNLFGGINSLAGIYLENMCDVVISDGSISSSSVVIDPADGIQDISDLAIELNNIDGGEVYNVTLSRSGLTREGVGLEVSNSREFTVREMIITNRVKAFEFNGNSNSTYTLECNTFYDNDLGVDFNTGGRLVTLIDNHFECNDDGLDADFDLFAQANYWGANDGPSNDGGSGDSYIETSGAMIDASNFLTMAPGCAATPPTPQLIGNSVNISNGDMSPDVSDHTDFETETPGNTITRTFTIKNIGDAPLKITASPLISLSGAADFSLMNVPAMQSLNVNEEVDFDVEFLAPATYDLYEATVSATLLGCDRDMDYTYDIQADLVL